MKSIMLESNTKVVIRRLLIYSVKRKDLCQDIILSQLFTRLKRIVTDLIKQHISYQYVFKKLHN